MGEILQPRDEADVADIIAARREPLEIVGAGSKRAIGRAGSADVLDLTALHGIVDYEPGELVLTARAATKMTVVAQALADRGQRLAFEPPDFAQLLGTSAVPTLGGVIAANISGSRRLTAGAARDHFLGCRAVSGEGERFRAGGRVVKNVTGYDLPKLLAGSWGTLAVLTEITMRVHPAAECERTLILPARNPRDISVIFRRALGSDCDVSGAASIDGRDAALRLEGVAPSVRAREADLLTLLAPSEVRTLEGAESLRFWRAIGSADALAAEPVVWRLAVTASDAPAVLEALMPRRFIMDWGGALLWIGGVEVDAPRVRAAIGAGHATLVKAGAAARAANCVFQPQPAPLAALGARLKAAFDPHGRLNPGRMS
ncbi:MAG TPA: FAD-binding protein [Steroidobacteraceae bacterium]|nr:FAD-binding protein [Steroidobacteraceae bacterium]